MASALDIGRLPLVEHQSQAELAAWGVPALKREVTLLQSKGHVRGAGAALLSHLEAAGDVRLLEHVCDLR